jgi:selenocysteine-specific elongation factor
MILGTAGHVDHGKTSLVKALTGIDTDRLPEEKRRGITLELGFAHLDLPSGARLGVIDVPGHERFVRAMAAGAGGVDIALLVVAADEGVMPQTREHLDVCRLLGVRRGLLVVSKADLLPGLGAGWLELLEVDLRGLVEGSPFEGAPLLPVSAKTGEGLPRLVTELDRLATALAAEGPSQRSADGPLFMPIDRAFIMKGFGVVVTGTAWSGAVRVGDSVALLPARPGPFRVRGMQVHGQPVERAAAGQRVAVNLPELEVSQVHRGLVLTRAGELRPTRAVDVELELLASLEAPLPRRSRQLVTLGAATHPAVLRLHDVDSLRPGERCFAQLRFGAPVAAMPGLRFIVRGSAAPAGRGTTIAGGRVLTLDPPRRQRGAAEALKAFADAGVEARLGLLLGRAGYAGLDEAGLFALAGVAQKALGRALEAEAARGRVVLVDREARRYVAGDVLRALEARVVARLDELHRAAPERPGVPREELRQRLGEPPERVFARALEHLVSRRQVEVAGELLRRPGQGGAVTAAAAAQRAALLAALTQWGLTPPTLAELASSQRLSEARVVELGQALVAEGLAVRAGELFFARAAVDALEAKLLAHFAQHERLSTQQFKALTGLSRKFLIPLAEYFDRERLTLRVGEERVLRKRA